MKKRNLILLSLTLTLLVGCNRLPSASSSGSETNSSLDSGSLPSEEQSEEPSEIPSSTDEVIPPTSSEPPLDTFKVTLQEGSYSKRFSYAEGNFDSFTVSGTSFNFYRGVYPLDNYFMRLLPHTDNYRDLAEPGYVSNLTPLYGIQHVRVQYFTEGVIGNPVKVRFGANMEYGMVSELPLSEERITMNIALPTSHSFFRIETSSVPLNILKMEVYYTNSGEVTSYEPTSVGEHNFRINPLPYEGTLSEGLQVSVPSLVNEANGYYDVLETKEYTYYSSDYVLNNPALVELASYTHPIDVAAYFTIFGTWPANYGGFNKYAPYGAADFYDLQDVFGDDARRVQIFSRTDGYALAVPYRAGSDGLPVYYELDIDVNNSYHYGSRGSGRVVAWEYGWDSEKGATDYYGRTAVFTNDHYVTFAEYNNAGSYGRYFNGEYDITAYTWGPARTLLPR